MSGRKENVLRGFKANDPVSEHALAEFSKASKFQLPPDYLEFVRHMNGGEGFVGEWFIRFYKVEELLELNGEYMAELFPGFFLFGSDGGGEAFALDTRKDPPSVVMIPFVGSRQDAINVGSSFSEFLANVSKPDFEPFKNRQSTAP